MRRQIVSAVAVVLVICMALSSCSKKAANFGELTFDSLQVNTTEHLYGEDDKPACNIDISLTYVSSSIDTKMQDSLNYIFLSEALGSKYAQLDPKGAAQEAFTKDYVDSYRTDLEPLYKQEIAEQGDQSASYAWYSYYKYISTSIETYSNHLLTYRIYTQDYTGGAHGIYNTEIVNIDLRTLRRITLDDIILDDQWEELSELILQKLMADQGVSTMEDLEDLGYGATGEMQLAPVDNFILRPGSITFLYNVYEIAPYVMGLVEITLSFDELSALLDTDYMIVRELL